MQSNEIAHLFAPINFDVSMYLSKDEMNDFFVTTNREGKLYKIYHYKKII